MMTAKVERDDWMSLWHNCSYRSIVKREKNGAKKVLHCKGSIDWDREEQVSGQDFMGYYSRVASHVLYDRRWYTLMVS